MGKTDLECHSPIFMSSEACVCDDCKSTENGGAESGEDAAIPDVGNVCSGTICPNVHFKLLSLPLKQQVMCRSVSHQPANIKIGIVGQRMLGCLSGTFVAFRELVLVRNRNLGVLQVFWTTIMHFRKNNFGGGVSCNLCVVGGKGKAPTFMGDNSDNCNSKWHPVT